MEFGAKVLGFVFVFAIVFLLLTFPLMWAINWLIAPSLLITIFGVAKLTFWKTFVLSFVAAALFGKTAGKS